MCIGFLLSLCAAAVSAGNIWVGSYIVFTYNGGASFVAVVAGISNCWIFETVEFFVVGDVLFLFWCF